MEILNTPWPSTAITVSASKVPDLVLKSTSGEFRLPAGSAQRMYVCGITPYDATHLGHAATYLTFDLINRYQRLSGGEVYFVENITDIDEPLLERAARDSIDWATLAQKETDLFASDMTALRVLPPEWFVPATKAIDLVEAAITVMKEKGYVYSVEKDLYFRTSSFLTDLPYPLDACLELFADRGGDPGRAGKEHPLDPILWLANKNSEPGWKSSHGFGRPGWHIECAVISLRYLVGPDFLSVNSTLSSAIDIQGGGNDLIFPHHFMSTAHVQAITGHAFARGDVHTGLIGLEGEKMSKSKGNLVFVSKLLQQGVDPVVIRYALLSEHYSLDRMWTNEKMIKAAAEVEAIRSALSRQEVAPTAEVIRAIVEALANNLDTPTVMKTISEWVLATEKGATGGSTGEMARAFDSALGLAF